MRSAVATVSAKHRQLRAQLILTGTPAYLAGPFADMRSAHLRAIRFLESTARAGDFEELAG